MVGEMNFWDIEMWSFVITLAILLGAMLLANLLRREVGFLRRSLLPSSVLGGFIILAADALYKLAFGRSMFQIVTLEALTFHGLGLGFVALAWRTTERLESKKAKRDVFFTSTVTVGSYLLQAVIGLLITVSLSYVIRCYPAGGLLLPMGYGQGPGQAYNWGSIYQGYTEYPAFQNGASFGLTVAAMGFVSASIGGVLYLNRLRRSGDKRLMRESADAAGSSPDGELGGRGEIPVSESMDKLTVQFAFIFVTYFLAFAGMYGLSLLLDKAGGFCVNTVKPLLWGFNFLVGTAVTVLFKSIYKKLRAKRIIEREYINNFMLNRISGLMFDVMVTASIAAIDLSAFRCREFRLPLLLLCVAGAVVTYFYTRRICRRLFPDYSDEMFLAMYGMLTGTASTGVILLRELDPLFMTPASHNLIYQNIWSIVLGAPMLLLLGFAARSLTWSWLCLGICVLLFLVITAIQLFANKKGKV